jgi:isovaleryl-CoA dehydrogenase
MPDACHLRGGYGFMWDSEVGRIYRGTGLHEIGVGITEVCQLIVSGKLNKPWPKANR